jgi:hypothetical protein
MSRPSDPLPISYRPRTPGPDESCAILRGHLQDCIPFSYVKIGDGVVCNIFGVTVYGRGEAPDANGLYLRPETGALTLSALVKLADSPEQCFFGELPEGLAEQWAELCRLIGHRSFLSSHVVENDRPSMEVVGFYRDVAADPRRKAYVAPAPLQLGAKMMGADWVPVPLGQEWQDSRREQDTLIRFLSAYEVVLLSAAHAAKYIAGELIERDPSLTVIDLGSSLDPLLWQPTRSGQVDRGTLRWLYADLLSRST